MTKDLTEHNISGKCGRKVRRIIGLLGFILMPVISFYLFEYVTGNIQYIANTEVLCNIGWYYVIYLVLLALSGTSRFAVPAGSLFFLAISIAESFVMDFRSRPITPWDITAFDTAMTVTKNYSFILSEQMKTAIATVAALNLLLLFMPFNAKGLIRRVILSTGCLGLAAAYGIAFFAIIIPAQNYTLNIWDINSTYQEYGYILSTVIFEKYIVKKPPEGYSRSRVAEITAAYDNNQEEPVRKSSSPAADSNANCEAASQTIQPVNIICIMNESFSDLKTAGDFTTNADYLPFWYSLKENVIRGSLCVPVFGSMTSNSEYEFLTGDSMAMLPLLTCAYQFNVMPDALSLVSTLKDQGYSAVAMHPYPGDNWNRNNAYRNLGFDEFFDIDYYTGCQELRCYVSDKADYDKLIERVMYKENPDDKLFLFNVTMQNHGGYDQSFDNFEEKIRLTGELEGRFPETDRYLSLIKASDEAFQQLIDYFTNFCDQPTMIVMFGDHQPSVEDEFYNDIADVPTINTPAADCIKWYQTPFMIWTNYEQPSADLGKLGSIYLSSYVLKTAGLKMTPYNNLLLSLSHNVPVIHPNGCYDSKDNFYTWDEINQGSCPYSSSILDYEYFAYNHCLDSKKYTAAFELTEAEKRSH